MKIIHVIPGFLPEHVAGTEIYCWSICKYLLSRGEETEVVIPGFGQQQNSEYIYDGIRVIKYAEPTQQNRLHISGLTLPEGIKNFRQYIQDARPDCVHFHGIYAGIGITVQHIVEVKALGIPVIYTMHLPGHICATETLIYKEKEICDGIIRPVRCASCHLVHQGNGATASNIMAGLSGILQKTGIDAGYWNSSLGTGLSCVNRITDIQKRLRQLAGAVGAERGIGRGRIRKAPDAIRVLHRAENGPIGSRQIRVCLDLIIRSHLAGHAEFERPICLEPDGV